MAYSGRNEVAFKKLYQKALAEVKRLVTISFYDQYKNELDVFERKIFSVIFVLQKLEMQEAVGEEETNDRSKERRLLQDDRLREGWLTLKRHVEEIFTLDVYKLIDELKKQSILPNKPLTCGDICVAVMCRAEDRMLGSLRSMKELKSKVGDLNSRVRLAERVVNDEKAVEERIRENALRIREETKHIKISDFFKF